MPNAYAINVPVPVRHPETRLVIGHRAKWHGVMPGEPVVHYINRHETRSLRRGKRWHCDDRRRPNHTAPRTGRNYRAPRTQREGDTSCTAAGSL